MSFNQCAVDQCALYRSRDESAQPLRGRATAIIAFFRKDLAPRLTSDGIDCAERVATELCRDSVHEMLRGIDGILALRRAKNHAAVRLFAFVALQYQPWTGHSTR